MDDGVRRSPADAGETAFHERGRGDGGVERRRRSQVAAAPPALEVVWTDRGICLVGTHDLRGAVSAWSSLADAVAAARGATPVRPIDAASWWHAQRRWALRDAQGWRIVRAGTTSAQPVLLLVGTYR